MIKKFKDTKNGVHEIDENFKHLLPIGCVEITEIEATELLKPVITDEQQKAAALAELNALDLSSIRALREYVASRPDAPQFIKDKEAAAMVARGKLAK